MGYHIPALLPPAAILQRTPRPLCDVCSKLGISQKRFVVLPGDQEDNPGFPFRLGRLQEIEKKAFRCPFCLLVFSGLDPDTYPVVRNPEDLTVHLDWMIKGPPGKSPTIRVATLTLKTAAGRTVSNKINFPEIAMLANDVPPGAKRTELPRVIHEEKIDFTMVKNWLGMCDKFHGGACRASPMMDGAVGDPANLADFRLIDIRPGNACLTKAPANTTYIALSYTWGDVDRAKSLELRDANEKKLTRKGGLQRSDTQIPLTIRDAMDVATKLKVDYLWVDSLCINQDHFKDSATKNNMDLIYASAYVTICAADGIGANAGLPGVRPNTRGISQNIQEVAPKLRLTLRKPYQDILMDSYYHKRGWTFQEFEFSKRKLIFIAGQVVFNCQKGADWREDTFFEDDIGVVDPNPPPIDTNDVAFFNGDFSEYTRRSLTRESDIYHAFIGFANHYRRALKANLVHGIPDAFFDWFLLWTSDEVQKRFAKAPSWSWSGWKGESSVDIWNWYSRSIAKVKNALPQRTWIIWYHRSPTKKDKTRCLPLRTPPPAPGRNFYGGPIKKRFDINTNATEPTSREVSADAPKYYHDELTSGVPGSGYLQFWTVYLVFKLNALKTNPEKGSKNRNTPLGIYGVSGKQLGIVYLNPSWARANTGKHCEFIVICEARDTRAKRGTDRDAEEGWVYKVMLIEKKGDWYERVSIGSIGKGDVKESKPVAKWKEIILG